MNGSSIASMAWRNLWRNRRRTLLTLSSIAFGTSLAILFTGIGDSNWREMIDLARKVAADRVISRAVLVGWLAVGSPPTA